MPYLNYKNLRVDMVDIPKVNLSQIQDDLGKDLLTIVRVLSIYKKLRKQFFLFTNEISRAFPKDKRMSEINQIVSENIPILEIIDFLKFILNFTDRLIGNVTISSAKDVDTIINNQSRKILMTFLLRNKILRLINLCNDLTKDEVLDDTKIFHSYMLIYKNITEIYCIFNSLNKIKNT